MPVIQHLLDAAGIAGLLWDEWLPMSVKQRIESDLPTGAQDGRALASWLAGLHDVGKCSPAFAVQMESLAGAMNRVGLSSPVTLPDRSQVPHALAGQVALKDWLVDGMGASTYVADTYADVVGVHHGRASSADASAAARRRPDLLGDDTWRDTRVEIIEGITRRVGASSLVPAWAAQCLPPKARILVSAVVVLADWLASDQMRFPLITHPTSDPDRLTDAWADLDLPEPWRALPNDDDVDELLAARFPTIIGRSARPVQRSCVELAREVSGPSMMIVEAPMGVGKTEAALLAAEQLAARDGSGGVFVALPTMATSDAMFSRVRSWVDALPGEARRSMFLAHGKAGLNDQYAGMARDAWAYDIHGDEPRSRAAAVASSWLSGRRKGVLADFVVGTVDQVLYLSLHQKFLPLRHLGLAGKVVVIDEVHAADAVMQAYLARTLEWLAAYGTSVVLLSATLPSGQRRDLVEAYQNGLASTGPVGPPSYPCVTVVDDTGVRGLEVALTTAPVDIRVELLDDEPETLRERLRQVLWDGGCAAVIRDTVGRAQDTFEALREDFGDDVRLVHSRYLSVDRAQREAELRDLLGPDAARRPDRLVVVGTQVLEQSLDVDFDVMVSDIAPVDLVLQRVGRLHRHHRPANARPEPVSVPTLLLTGITDWSAEAMPAFDRGPRAVYGESLLFRTVAALGLGPGSRTTLSVPTDVQALVEQVYGPEPAVPDSWLEAVRAADARREQHIADVRRDRTRGRRLSEVPAFSETTFSDLLLPGADDPDALGGGASVRDGEDGLEVVVVRRDADGLTVMPGDFAGAGLRVPDLMGPPDDATARVLAACTVRLPMAMTHPGAIDQVLDELKRKGYGGFQQSRWLQGQLVLTLNADSEATVGPFHLRYDNRTGLRVTKEGG